MKPIAFLVLVLAFIAAVPVFCLTIVLMVPVALLGACLGVNDAISKRFQKKPQGDPYESFR